MHQDPLMSQPKHPSEIFPGLYNALLEDAVTKQLFASERQEKTIIFYNCLRDETSEAFSWNAVEQGRREEGPFLDPHSPS